MSRLFAGLEIPSEISDRLALMRNGLKKARWIEPSDYHVTLRFFGEIDADLANDIGTLFGTFHKPVLSLTIDGLDAFGGTKPRAIFARIKANPQLDALQNSIEQMAQRAGCAPETRKFTPHITLARVNNISSTAIAAWLSHTGNFTSQPFDIDRFAMFSARPSRGGGPYVVEQRYGMKQA